MKPFNKTQSVDEVFFFADLSKASPQAIMKLLDALNTELDEAVAQNRFPTVEGAFSRLHPTPTVMM